VLDSPFNPIRNIMALARNTFLEVLREKILYNVFLIGVLVFGLGILASQLSFGNPERVVLDFGVLAVALSSSIIAILLGSTVVLKEFNRRTVFVILAHPVSGFEFIIGKFLGVAAVLSVNWLLSCILFTTLLWGIGLGNAGANFSTLWVAFSLSLLQALVLAGVIIAFSTFTTSSISIMASAGLYLIGHGISQLTLVAAKAEGFVAKCFFKSLLLVLPNLEHFSLGLRVTYGLPVGFQLIATSLFYALCWVVFTLLVAGALLKYREV